jgi:hypothetical protein
MPSMEMNLAARAFWGQQPPVVTIGSPPIATVVPATAAVATPPSSLLA